MARYNLFFLFIAIILTAGCQTGKDQDKYSGIPERKLFTMAQEKLASHQYAEAAEMFESFNSQYPASDFAEQATMESIYSNYKKGGLGYDLALAESVKFELLYPKSKQLDYVLYLKGVINTDHNRYIMETLFKENLSTRDLNNLKQAYDDFDVLIQKFPESPYAADARHRMIYLRNLLAQAELNVAQYYFERKLYVAAINRAIYLIENYSQAPQGPKALNIIKQANIALGLDDSAKDIDTIVNHNN